MDNISTSDQYTSIGAWKKCFIVSNQYKMQFRDQNIFTRSLDTIAVLYDRPYTHYSFIHRHKYRPTKFINRLIVLPIIYYVEKILYSPTNTAFVIGHVCVCVWFFYSINWLVHTCMHAYTLLTILHICILKSICMYFSHTVASIILIEL